MSFDSLENKVILVTGGTGSFGQRFVTRLLENSLAKKVIVFSRDELKQSEMQAKFRGYEDRLRFFIGDVRDIDRLQRAFDGVDVVVHAAALKQVPALEYNPFEAIKTNVLGTQNVITAALDQEVEKVVLISTDKAANPANLYGATKLCAEKLMVSSNAYSGDKKTRFSVVRYGNVFGSRGSLIKVLDDQKKTGKLSLTHEEMTRFWITLDQGIALVMLALEKMHGGEIFIPKVPSMKVKDMIQKLAPGYDIDIVGIRPGEKIHEVLVTPEEARHTKEFKDYFVIIPESDWWKKENHGDGNDLPNDFYFSSFNNSWWLDGEALIQLINSI